MKPSPENGPATPIPAPETIHAFRRAVYRHFKLYGRVLPWRTDYDPYHILVSEIMLQQTQVDRVIDKFNTFVEMFPDVQTLADASLEAVLQQWQGLGYNRRGVALREAAKIVVRDYKGVVPDSPEQLGMLPGIGPATAASIAAFAFNRPTLFLETNIRTVLIHHFFGDQQNIDDAMLLPVAEAVLDRRRPRSWYSALMDYGTTLKKEVGNLSRRSASYKKQSRFEGSRRQVRGAILKWLLLDGRTGTAATIVRHVRGDPLVIAELLKQMLTEGLLMKTGPVYRIAG